MRIQTLFTRLMLLLLLCLPAAWVQAQSGSKFEIHGYLVDPETSDPWVGVTVVVQGTSVGALTDEHGKFVLVLPTHPQTDNITLLVRGIEFENQSLVTQCPADVDRIEPNFELLNPLGAIAAKKAIDGDGARGGYGGHGGHGDDFGPGHGDGKILTKPQRPGEYYVDREGIVWKMAY